MSSFYNKFQSWRDSFIARKNYSTMDKYPFFEIVVPYLPKDKFGVIVDIGAGYGGFAKHLDLYSKYKNVVLLDSNKQTIEYLISNKMNAILYKAPEKLPFRDGTVSFIHCSHMVEYLNHTEFYSFLKEINRVLNNKGILVISAPLLWGNFYDDLNHVKPYNPNVFISYLHKGYGERTLEVISNNYIVKKLVYRYTKINFVELGANNAFLDFIIQLSKQLLRMIGVIKYKKNGYTIVLQKDEG